METHILDSVFVIYLRWKSKKSSEETITLVYYIVSLGMNAQLSPISYAVFFLLT